MEERTERLLSRKLVYWHKDCLIGITKAAHANRANQGIPLLLPMGRPVFSNLQKSRAPSHRTVPPVQASSSSSFLPPLYILSMLSHGLEYTFGHLRSPISHLSPPSLLHTSSFFISMAVQKAENSLSLCKQLSKTKTISILRTLYSAQIHNIGPY